MENGAIAMTQPFMLHSSHFQALMTILQQTCRFVLLTVTEIACVLLASSALTETTMISLSLGALVQIQTIQLETWITALTPQFLL
jgi:hypothetical protein